MLGKDNTARDYECGWRFACASPRRLKLRRNLLQRSLVEFSQALGRSEFVKIFKIVNLVLLIILGISSGIAKIMRIPQEMEFFHEEMGFSVTIIVALGIAQVAAAILMLVPRSRTAGAVVLVATLIFSTVVIFMSGNNNFGLFSMIPILMCGVVIAEGNLLRSAADSVGTNTDDSE